MLADAVVYALDMGALLAGTKYRGDFDSASRAVLKQFSRNAVLFIDEIHTPDRRWLSLGRHAGCIQPAQARAVVGQLKCIGATTFTEYRGIFEKDAAVPAFQKIDVTEPTVEQTVDILKGLKTRFEEHHGVKYAVGALQAAAELSAKYINDRHLPDKAIDVIDEAGAAADPAQDQTEEDHRQAEVEEIVAKIARIRRPACPATTAASSRPGPGPQERGLRPGPAIDAWPAIKMALARAWTATQSRLAAFLFSGPTGVGKTEVAASWRTSWASS